MVAKLIGIGETDKKCPHCKKVKRYLDKQNVIYSPISIKNSNAVWFLRILGITKVPVMLKSDENSILIIEGDTDIIAHFKNDKTGNISDKKVDKKSLYSKDKTEGCSIDSVNNSVDSGCEDSTSEIPYR